MGDGQPLHKGRQLAIALRPRKAGASGWASPRTHKSASVIDQEYPAKPARMLGSRPLSRTIVFAPRRDLKREKPFHQEQPALFVASPNHNPKLPILLISYWSAFPVCPRFPCPAFPLSRLDFPPAPKLTPLGRLDPEKATEGELRGEKLFFGKAVRGLSPAPSFLANPMHDLHVERFLKGEVGDGPIKSFTLRSIKDSPPYLHDGRCLTLEDTVEFFNLVLALKLSKEEKQELVAFLRQL